MCNELLHVHVQCIYYTGEKMVYDGPYDESMTDSQHEQGKH